MGAPVLKRFGRYFILDALSKGGMAEVFRGRRMGKSTTAQIIALKQIGEHYAKEEAFIQMFKDEINIMMGLNHPNIVQLYDYGVHDKKPFIAMEYIFGTNLRELIVGMIGKEMLPQVALAAYIAEQVAAGLHYAHTFKDRLSGKSLRIVHRDISPRNIVVSYDGNVKIIDFGVAKTTINTEHTKTGVIKGNLGYLSPELVAGEDPDPRSDVFSLGVVLWELLTNRRFFQTENMSEFAILKQIDACDQIYKAPSQVKPGIPPELDAIVAKAMAKPREDRYQDAQAFHLALRRFLQNHYMDFTAASAKQVLDYLFTEQRRAERAHLKALNDQAEEILKHIPRGEAPPAPPPSLARATETARGFEGGASGSATISPSVQTTPSLAMVIASKLSFRRALAIVALVLLSTFFVWKTETSFRKLATTGPAGGELSPPAFPRLLAWFHAGNLMKYGPGEKISFWEDEGAQIDRNPATQSDVAFQPRFHPHAIGNRPAVEFDGKKSFLAADRIAKKLRTLKEFTLSMVVQLRNERRQFVFACYFADKNTDVFRFGFEPGRTAALGTTGNKNISIPLASNPTSSSVYSMTVSEKQVELFMNGNLLQRFYPGRIAFEELEYCAIGQDYDEGRVTDVLQGYLSELLIYDRILMADELKALDAFLITKYGIVSQP